MEGIDVVGVVAVVFGALLLALGMVCWTLVALFKPKRNGGNADESKLIQELHDGLQRMEARVESLETLLIRNEQSAGPRTRN